MAKAWMGRGKHLRLFITDFDFSLNDLIHNRTMLNEAKIKAAVIDYLFARGMLDNAVLINEMVVADWSRRADLVVANGRLYGFEIKSDLDTLKRLDGQLQAYVGRFDKVIVVVTSRWLESVLRSVPAQVEVWEARELADQKVSIKLARRGKLREIKNPRLLCGYLHKTEIAALLRSQGISANTDMPRALLVKQTEIVPLKRLRAHVLQSVQTRYKNTYKAFLEVKRESTRPEDIKTLSKLNLDKRILVEQRRDLNEYANNKNTRALDLEWLARKYGPLPRDMPASVLKRKRPLT